MAKLTLKDVALADKRVLMRVDFNVPLDENQQITDDARIQAALPSIQYVIEQGGKLILMSHLGRPKGNVVPKMSLTPAATRLSELLGQPVPLAPDCVGAEVEAMAARMNEGDVLLLENLRFHPEEEKNDPAFAEQLAALGDCFVNDAFGTAHRAHASTEGVTHFFDQCAAGFLMQKELEYLGAAVGQPKRPFVAILGGAKVSDKIPVIEHLLTKVDTLILGGGMAFTFFKAQGKEIGSSLLDADRIAFAGDVLAQAGDKFALPVDCVVTDKLDFDGRKVGAVKTVPSDQIPADWEGVDIGPETIKQFSEIIKSAKTVVWNGPMGVFEIEETAKGTFAIAEALAEATKKGATTIIGGGDSASAVKQAGVEQQMSHVSTGGGASLEFLEGKALPGVEALTER